MHSIRQVSLGEGGLGPLPLLWSLEFLPCSGHGVGWVLSKARADGGLAELQAAQDLE